jgi:hypothetical protein
MELTQYDFKKRLKCVPKPQTDAELEILSSIYFCKALHAEFRIWPSTGNWAGSGYYKIKEPYNSYHGTGFEYECRSCVGYDKSAVFWDFVFGELYCGGIAGHSYGQFRTQSYRDMKRLMRWKDSRSSGDSGRVRQAFARLAKQHGLGENSSTPDGGCTA